MVPTGPGSNKLNTLRDRLWAMRRPLGWGGLLWVVTVVGPFAWMYPDHGLGRPMMLVLAILPAVAMLVSAAANQPQLLLGMGLAAQLPVLVACPQLLGPRVTGAIQAMTVAVLIMLFVSSSADLEVGAGDRKVRRVATTARLRNLIRPPRDLRSGVLIGLAGLWLVMAWWVDDVPAEKVEKLRASRAAAVALCWMAAHSVPLSGHKRREQRPDTPVALLGRRAVWIGLLIGAWWWLQAAEATP